MLIQNLKIAFDEKVETLKTKKANLESAETYFDLTNVKKSSIFNKVDDETIDLISQKKSKINNYENLSEEMTKQLLIMMIIQI